MDVRLKRKKEREKESEKDFQGPLTQPRDFGDSLLVYSHCNIIIILIKQQQFSIMDLSLYLVTDSTPAILKGRDLCWVVEEALKGGRHPHVA